MQGSGHGEDDPELDFRDTLADVLGLDQVLGLVLALHAALAQALDHLVREL